MIARTLGVVDSTKASTNDKRILKGPIVQVVDVDAQAHSEIGSKDKSTSSIGYLQPSAKANLMKQEESPALFVFSPSEGNLHISPSTIFSPPTSRPSSPQKRSFSDVKCNSSSTISDTESFIVIENKYESERSALRRRETNYRRTHDH